MSRFTTVTLMHLNAEAAKGGPHICFASYACGHHEPVAVGNGDWDGQEIGVKDAECFECATARPGSPEYEAAFAAFMQANPDVF